MCLALVTPESEQVYQSVWRDVLILMRRDSSLPTWCGLLLDLARQRPRESKQETPPTAIENYFCSLP